MRLAILAAMTALLAACSGETAKTTAEDHTTTEAVAENTRVAATLIYADWCSSCKIIEPKIDVVKEGGSIDGVEWVTLDYTARDADAFFASADELGIGEAIRDQLGGDVITGILLLVDIDTKKVVADLRKELSPEELRSAIEAAAAS